MDALANAPAPGGPDADLRARLIFLNEATRMIGSSLELAEVADGLARAVVPFLADFGSVQLHEELFGPEPPDPRAPVSPGLIGAFRRLVIARGDDPAAWGAIAPDGQPRLLPPAGPESQMVLAGQPLIVSSVDRKIAGALADLHQAGNLESVLNEHSMLAIPIETGGQPLGGLILLRRPGRPPFGEIDILLAGQLAAQASLAITSGRRYRDEAAIADALQRSMLPEQPPRLAGAEIAHRYLPASRHPQIGGDWFDAIPLPGGRIALVVGDVMGHGLRSAEVMGHLRTAVQTLAALDLPGEQVFRQLDEIAQRLDDDHLATCLYAIYDPVAQTCVITNAGHIPPVLVHANGLAELLSELPTGSPIGVGGVAFESIEVKTADGDLLVLCTDGLVETPGQDIALGLAALCANVATPGVSPDELCDILLRARRAEDRRDDIAVLVARLRGIPSANIAQWLLSPRPTTPRLVRRLVRQTLGEWAMPGCADVAELLASELATNAIRHTSQSISLRLMRTDVLLCEVSDDDHHLPALQAASELDESGRGMHLVSRLSRHWGANWTRDGKVVWFELAIPAPA